MSNKIKLFVLMNVFFILFSNIKCNNVKFKNYDKFITHIFNKYGSKGVINFEGLEHLMHNLGIGNVDFYPSHTIDNHRTQEIIIPLSVVEDDRRKTDSEIDAIVHTDSIYKLNHKHKHNNFGEYSVKSDTTKDKSGEIKIDSYDEYNSANKENNIYEKESSNDEIYVSNIWSNIELKEIHDATHRHIKHPDERINESCLSPFSIARLYLNTKNKKLPKSEKTLNENEDYLVNNRKRRRHIENVEDRSHTDDEDFQQLFKLSNIKITPESFIRMCPVLLSQIDEGSCNEILKTKPVQLFEDAWIYATVAIIIISLCGLSGVALVPLAKSVAYDEILRFLVSIAVGTLCGDALMHLLPHAIAPHIDHGNDNIHPPSTDEPVWICASAFASALLMYVLEKFIPLLRGKSSGHGHSHFSNQNNRNENIIELNISNDNQNILEPKEVMVMLKEEVIDKKMELSPVAFMVVIGDGLHNITDGLAIGAAFALDPITGMATALAVLCHELPHELGDFALLISTGVSIKRAMYFNLISSILSFVGMIIGLVIAQMHTSVVRWIYSATAGTFLYIAFADLIPELNKEVNTIKMMTIQVCGIGLGGIIMLLIGLYEDHLRILFE